MGNWINVVPPIYRKGRLLESESSDCIKIRWTPLDPSIDFICDDCGYMRWVNLDPSTDYLCSGVTKMYKQQLQESSDSGSTWYNVIPPVYRMGEAYQYYSTDCGYAERWINMDINSDYWCDDCGQESEYYYKYFTLVAVDNCEFYLELLDPGTTGDTPHFYYSTDNARTWTEYSNYDGMPSSYVSVSAGNKVIWKSWENGYTDTYSKYKNVSFKTKNNRRFNVEGNIMSLAYGTFFLGEKNLEKYKFNRMFQGSSVVDASNLIMPATTLRNLCYQNMFSGCTSLTTAPSVLPATTLSNYCYNYMFVGCTSLTAVPVLSATTLAEGCCEGMFSGCTALTTIPSNMLPATTLATSCYNNMFVGCTALTTIPNNMFHATTLANYCYMRMFSGCTSLTAAPVLSATTLAEYCYAGMFGSCTSLTTIPSNMLPATTLVERCYDSLFWGCTSLTTVPRSLLPASIMKDGCYIGMFAYCTSLTTAPDLSATTLAESCYLRMFEGCTSLPTAPDLPAASLPNQCYQCMFSGCTNLSYVKCMADYVPHPQYTTVNHPTYNWLADVAQTGTFVQKESTSWGNCGIDYIPCGWTIIKIE